MDSLTPTCQWCGKSGWHLSREHAETVAAAVIYRKDEDGEHIPLPNGALVVQPGGLREIAGIQVCAECASFILTQQMVQQAGRLHPTLDEQLRRLAGNRGAQPQPEIGQEPRDYTTPRVPAPGMTPDIRDIGRAVLALHATTAASAITIKWIAKRDEAKGLVGHTIGRRIRHFLGSIGVPTNRGSLNRFVNYVLEHREAFEDADS